MRRYLHFPLMWNWLLMRHESLRRWLPWMLRVASMWYLPLLRDLPLRRHLRLLQYLSSLRIYFLRQGWNLLLQFVPQHRLLMPF